MNSKQDLLRNLPSVDELLRDAELLALQEQVARGLVKTVVREVLDGFRRDLLAAPAGKEVLPDPAEIVRSVAEQVRRKSRPHFQRVINATGVVVHTNLGRSLLAAEAVQQVAELATHYSNLEFDLEEGRRGSRYSHVEELLTELTGAESALVVNNNAAAVFLVLETLSKGREAVVSRGELVEIGGSFRIPDVMARSGAIMVEVGTTNKTHLKDYVAVINERTALLLKVHTSNYRIIGFTQDVSLEELSRLGAEHGLPVVNDLGSGCFIDFSKYGIIKEPTVQETIRSGASIATFSGDKLLGGPQAGIVLGKREYVEQVKRNPLNRAFRIDKMTLAALEATLLLYRDPDKALKKIPTLAMITVSRNVLSRRAAKLKNGLVRILPAGSAEVEVRNGFSKVGGGALPEMDLPTRMVALTLRAGISAASVESRLRNLPLPVVCRVERDQVLLDVRTILDSEVEPVCEAFRSVLSARP